MIFNINVKDPSHPFYKKLYEIMSSYSLTQVVNDTTHVHYNGSPSTIDLVLISNLSNLSNCCSVPPLYNSDHNGLKVIIKWKAKDRAKCPHRTILRYSYVDWNKAH